MVLGKSDSELDCGEFDVERGNYLHFCVNQVLASLDNIQPGVNPDDPGCTPQCKGPPEFPGYALGAVMMENFQVNSKAGEAKYYKDPSLELNTFLGGQDG